jgi:hypothetical protein
MGGFAPETFVSVTNKRFIILRDAVVGTKIRDGNVFAKIGKVLKDTCSQIITISTENYELSGSSDCKITAYKDNNTPIIIKLRDLKKGMLVNTVDLKGKWSFEEITDIMKTKGKFPVIDIDVPSGKRIINNICC